MSVLVRDWKFWMLIGICLAMFTATGISYAQSQAFPVDMAYRTAHELIDEHEKLPGHSGALTRSELAV